MLWRKFKLDWTYAIGELVIVTLGVLIALGIQQWNEDRLDRVEEKAVLDRLLSDLGSDADSFMFLTSTSREKLERLARLNVVFDSGERPAEPKQFLQDIVGGAELGWFQLGAQRNTFDEILSSGRLGLIRHAALRDQLSRYYTESDSVLGRTDARESNFPELSYQLIPRQGQTRESFLGLSPDLTNQDIERLVDKVMASSIRDQVTGEMNLGRFILIWATNLESRRFNLEAAIREYREAL